MTVGLALILLAAIAVPHRLRLERASAGTAATIWMAALALRAVTSLFVVLFLVVYLPSTRVFGLLTHWCWHAVVPLLTGHFMLDGHSLGDVAVVAPAFALATSLLWVGASIVRAARSVGRMVRGSALPGGPQESLILRSGEVVVAAAGLARPRVVVSAGALTVLDDDELSASLAHERGHIERHHRFVVLLAEFLRAIGRFVPGTRAAHRELLFHLERDADMWAIERRHDPLALASAICKAATSARRNPAMATLGGGGATRRVGELVNGSAPRSRLAPAVAAGMVTLVVASAALVPAATAAGFDRAAKATPSERHCLD